MEQVLSIAYLLTCFCMSLILFLSSIQQVYQAKDERYVVLLQL